MIIVTIIMASHYYCNGLCLKIMVLFVQHHPTPAGSPLSIPLAPQAEPGKRSRYLSVSLSVCLFIHLYNLLLFT